MTVAARRSERLFPSAGVAGVLLGLALAGACRAADAPSAGPPHAVVASAAPAPAVLARFAVHDGFDRLVVPLQAAAPADSRQDGTVLTVTAPDMGQVRVVGRLGRRLVAVQATSDGMALTLAPGARARAWRMNDRLVIDVHDPQSRVAPARSTAPRAGDAHAVAQIAPPAAPKMAGPEAHAARPAEPPRVPAEPARAVAEAPLPPMAAPVRGFDTQAAPGDATMAQGGGAAVMLLPRDAGLPGPAILLPLGRDVGGAAFTRLGEAHAVFDVAQPLDLGALKDDAVFGTVREQVLPDGMHLRFRLGPFEQLRLVRRADGWAVAVVRGSGALAPPAQITGRVEKGVLALDADSPGRVVVLDDEPTGGRLLVGTQRSTGQREAAWRRMAEFALLPTWQGVAVEPVSDRLVMRPIPTGFELSAAGKPSLAVVWAGQPVGAWPDGRSMTRLFDLPDLPPPILARRLGQALREAAMAPKPQRFAPRVGVASAMLAEGLDVEAAAVLHAAQADDPTRRDDPVATGLSAIAAWLSEKAGGASAPPPTAEDLASLGQTDEAVLWRALLTSDQPDAAPQAAALATTWPLLLGYPPNLRRLALAPAASLLRAGGQDKALAALLEACPDQALDVERALLLRRQGQTDMALSLLDRVAARPDRLARAAAREESVGILLATHRIDEAGAAAALDHQLYAWRGGDRELRLRVKIARLRAQAGSWRTALAMLRATAALFPEAQARLRGEQEAVVADLLHGAGAARLSAFDLVTLTDEAADILTAASTQADLAPLLVDKLLALDLPSRAEPILRRLFEQAPAGGRKAEIGVRLAGLVADRDGGAALAVLDASPDDGLSDPLISRRSLLRAQILVRSGNAAGALATLSGQHDRAADDLRAGILEGQHDWAGATALLRATVSDRDFARLPEASQRDAILRLARDEAEASDVAGLQQLRQAQSARFASGKGARLFAVLTAPPVRNQDDLPRAANELAAMRALPSELARAQHF